MSVLSKGRRFLWQFAELSGLLIAALLFFTVGPEIENKLFPVKSDFEVDYTAVDGENLIIGGMMVKDRPCRYLKPTKAVTTSGINLLVKSTTGRNGANWLSHPDQEQRFGDWIVIGGAYEEIIFYQEHQCHPLWVTTTVLGIHDDTQREYVHESTPY